MSFWTEKVRALLQIFYDKFQNNANNWCFNHEIMESSQIESMFIANCDFEQYHYHTMIFTIFFFRRYYTIHEMFDSFIHVKKKNIHNLLCITFIFIERNCCKTHKRLSLKVVSGAFWLKTWNGFFFIRFIMIVAENEWRPHPFYCI